MTDKEINRAYPSRETLHKFLERAIADAAANDEDQRLGFRIDRIELTEKMGVVRFDLSCGAIAFIDLEYLVPRRDLSTEIGADLAEQLSK